MELVSLSMYTIDTKGGKILELNDGVFSDIKTLDDDAEGDAVKTLVLPWVQNTLPQKDVVYIRPEDDMPELITDIVRDQPQDWDGVILSGFCRGGTDLSTTKDKPFKLVNGEYVDLALYRNKGFMVDVARQAGATSMPRSAHYRSTINHNRIDDICSRMETDFVGVSHLVIKPLNASKGEGVVIISAEKAKEELTYLFVDLPHHHKISNRYKDAGFAEEFWRKQEQMVFQVQEFVEDKPTEHKGRKWDGTRRYLCATILQKDESGHLHAQTVVFGGLIKLPRMPISPNGDVDHQSRISFSYPHGISERLKRFWGLATPGSGDQLIIPRNQAVGETEQIRGDLNRLFLQARTMDVREYVRMNSKSDDLAQRILAQNVRGMFPEPSDKSNQYQYSSNYVHSRDLDI